jgi:phosphatidylserine/phosphatidylglycerophosphate/cardiolipin synthase-like enzyme
VIDTFFLRDTNHGGPKRQPTTVARKLEEFIAEARSTLDIAIYDFRLSTTSLANRVVGALSDAAQRGVTVRLAYDAGKPDKTTTSTFALMAADPAPIGTAQWVANHFGNTDVQIKAITAPSGQLMHSKFVARDGDKAAGTSAVWTGSTNWTDDAWSLQENNIVVVPTGVAAAAYRADFEQLWGAGSIKNTGTHGGGSAGVGTARVEWDFAPGDGTTIDTGLATVVSVATQRIVLAAMVVTSKTVISALVTAIANEVGVSGIYDSGQMGPIEREWAKSAKDAQVLADWRIIKTHLVAKRSTPYTPTSPHNFMHNKIIVADSTLITGSYNFSGNAEKNAENELHITNDQGLLDKYLAYISAISDAYA